MSKPEPIISKFAEFVERRSGRDFYIYTGIVISFGYALDFAGIQGNWAPRFGAVVAGTVAYCFFNDLRQHETWWRWLRSTRDDEIEEAEEPLRDARAVSKIMKARGNDQAAASYKSEAFLETRPQVRAATKNYWEKWSTARKTVKAEGRCIAIGTFVWAFGDIPVALFQCGGATC